MPWVNERDNVTTCGVRIDFTISVEKASRNSQARMRLVDVDHVTTVTWYIPVYTAWSGTRLLSPLTQWSSSRTRRWSRASPRCSVAWPSPPSHVTCHSSACRRETRTPPARTTGSATLRTTPALRVTSDSPWLRLMSLRRWNLQTVTLTCCYGRLDVTSSCEWATRVRLPTLPKK